MFRFGRRSNERSDQQICAAAVRQVAREVQVLEERSAKNPKKLPALQQARVRLEGERAKCLLEQRMKRKEMVYASRATRMASKAEMNRQRQEMLQGRYATKMQRLEYRKAKAEAGMGGPGPKSTAVGVLAVAAAGAALFFL